MSKIVYFCDSHLKGVSPRNRTDDYTKAVQDKLIEIWKIAKKVKAEFIICGGDVFDSYLVSNTLSDWFIDLVEEYKISLYVVPGNHEMYCANWSLSNGTTLAHIFRRSGLIKPLTEIETNDVYIKGESYRIGLEEDLNKEFPQHDKVDKMTIYIPHAMIVDVPVWFTSCVHYENINTNYDTVLISHNHKYWGIKEANGTKFIAPGAIARCYADQYDVGRIPSIVIIDTKKKDVEIVPLKSAKPVEEIFDLQKLAEQKANETKLEQFTEGLKNIKIQTMKVIDIVIGVCDNSKVDDTVKNSLKETIGLCEEENNG